MFIALPEWQWRKLQEAELMEINEKDRLLFMKYALPCAGTLVKRGSMLQKDVDTLIDIVKNGQKVPEGAEKNFKVAMAACTFIAKEKGKDLIDEDIIHEYFLLRHDDVIDRRYEEMQDFDPMACRVQFGEIEDIEKEFATVVTPDMRRKFRTDFVPGIKKNDKVVTHWDFVVEKKAK